MRYLPALLILSSCMSVPVPAVEPQPPDTPVVTAPAAPKPAAPTTAAAAVVKRFDQARVRELEVVTTPPDTVTPGQLQEIREADQGARAALYRLGRQGKHVTAAALKAADETVSALHRALSSALATGDSP
jgi:hypothetical protein